MKTIFASFIKELQKAEGGSPFAFDIFPEDSLDSLESYLTDCSREEDIVVKIDPETSGTFDWMNQL